MHILKLCGSARVVALTGEAWVNSVSRLVGERAVARACPASRPAIVWRPEVAVVVVVVVLALAR